MATKKTAKKASAKKTSAKKTSTKKNSAKKTLKKSTAKKTVQKASTKKKAVTSHKIGRNKYFSKKELKEQLNRLLILRERISGEISSISRDALESDTRDPSLSDQGTDTFDREFALSQLSSEQDVLFEIDEAIRRIENGTYGICELTGKPINIERLRALPYVRYSVEAQAELEKGSQTYRPFGNPIRGI